MTPLGLPVENALSPSFLALTELFLNVEILSDIGEFPPHPQPSSKLLVQILTVFVNVGVLIVQTNLGCHGERQALMGFLSCITKRPFETQES